MMFGIMACLLTIALLLTSLIYLYIRYRRIKYRKPDLSSIFNYSPYSSQQISKLVGEKILSNLVVNQNLYSVDQERLPLKFQSQWCEDILLYNCFKKKATGFYIEIGAFDGVKLSNTYFFECIGWTGLLVEPQPLQFEKLIVNRPNSLCENVCISTSKEDAVLNIVKEEAYETWSFISKKGENESPDIGFETSKINVKCKTINELIPNEISSIDFISIDVEGMEMEVLKTLDIAKYKPRIILLENPNNEINEYLLTFGYRPFIRTWINYLYTFDVTQFEGIDIYKDLGIEIKG